MKHPATTAEILEALESNAARIADFYRTLSDAAILTGDSDHWGPGHHLVHLTQTSAAVTRGLRSSELPAHAHRRSRSYAEVRDAAAASLAATSKERHLERGRAVSVAPGTRRDELVGAFVSASEQLRAAAGAWDDAALDHRAMRHPLAGEMTVREMLFFCVFHERHHLRQVQERARGDA
jgi:hypothetical protein